MRRPNGWSEERTCPWCRGTFTATNYQPDKRYCSQRCANSARSIFCNHYAEMGRLGRKSQQATQDARWAKKVHGMTPLEAYKAGRRDGYNRRSAYDYMKLKREEGAA
jgi:hypothetical protein